MANHRIQSAGRAVDFSCHNHWFQTDLARGYQHGSHPTRGSVFTNALVSGGNGYTLWLEYVRNHRTGEDGYFWFMWYDQSGFPTIPLSGVFTRDDLAEMSKRIAEFVP